jgi:hypothetical protein
LTNIGEFEGGKKIFKVTNREMVDTQVSDMLCSNFIEVGFGYQVEGMWSEMLFNRSFEKIAQLTPATYDWFGGKDVIGDDWTCRSGTTPAMSITAGMPARRRTTHCPWLRTARSSYPWLPFSVLKYSRQKAGFMAGTA